MADDSEQAAPRKKVSLQNATKAQLLQLLTKQVAKYKDLVKERDGLQTHVQAEQNKFQQLEATVESLRTEHEHAMAAARETSKAEETKWALRLEALEARLSDTKAALDATERAAEQATSEANELRQQLGAANAAMASSSASYEARHTELERQLSEAKAALSAAAAEGATEAARARELEQQLQISQAALDEAKKAVEKAAEAQSDAQAADEARESAQAAAAEAEASATSARVKELEAALEHAQAALVAAEQQAAAAIAASEASTAGQDSLRERVAGLEAAIAEATEVSTRQEGQLVKQQQQLEAAAAKAVEEEASWSAARDELEAAVARAEAGGRESAARVQELEAQLEEVRAELVAEKQARQKGVASHASPSSSSPSPSSEAAHQAQDEGQKQLGSERKEGAGAAANASSEAAASASAAALQDELVACQNDLAAAKAKVGKLTAAVLKYKEVTGKLQAKLKSQADALAASQRKATALSKDLSRAESLQQRANASAEEAAGDIRAVAHAGVRQFQDGSAVRLAGGDDGEDEGDAESGQADAAEWSRRFADVVYSAWASAGAEDSSMDPLSAVQRLSAVLQACKAQWVSAERARVSASQEAARTKEAVRSDGKAAEKAGEEKLARMKAVLVRANKHLDGNKKRLQVYKAAVQRQTAHLARLRRAASMQWGVFGVDDASVGENGGGLEAGSPEELCPRGKGLDAPASVARCRVVKRVEAAGKMWCLLACAAPRKARGDATAGSRPGGGSQRQASAKSTEYSLGLVDEEGDNNGSGGGGDNEGGNDGSQQQLHFWTPQSSWLQLRSERFRTTAQADEAEAASVAQAEAETAGSAQAVTLQDGTYLPPTQAVELEATVTTRLEAQWQASNEQYARSVAEQTTALEAAEQALAEAQAEHARYKARARGVLEAQEAEVAAAEALREELAARNGEVAVLQGELDRVRASLAGQRAQAGELASLRDECDALRFAADEARDEVARVKAASSLAAKEAQKELAHARAHHEEALSRLKEEADTARQAARDEFMQHREKARALLVDKDKALARAQEEIRSLRATGGPQLADSSISQASRGPAAESTGTAGMVDSTGGGLGAPIVGDGDDARSDGGQLEAMRRELQKERERLHELQLALQQQQQQQQQQQADGDQTGADNNNAAPAWAPQGPSMSADSGGSSLIHLAQVQAQKDQQLGQARAHVRKLQAMLRDSEVESAAQRDRHAQLQAEIKRLQATASRDEELNNQQNLEYLKNVVVRYLENGEEEFERMLPVIGTVLHLSPEEVERIKRKKAERSGWFGGFL